MTEQDRAAFGKQFPGIHRVVTKAQDVNFRMAFMKTFDEGSLLEPGKAVLEDDEAHLPGYCPRGSEAESGRAVSSKAGTFKHFTSVVRQDRFVLRDEEDFRGGVSHFRYEHTPVQFHRRASYRAVFELIRRLDWRFSEQETTRVRGSQWRVIDSSVEHLHALAGKRIYLFWLCRGRIRFGYGHLFEVGWRGAV